ncbi:hypothetical protein LTS18_006314 [Coniosporium uncinatum]|uniref:Uncharacterized protein n=1 Tax=Coniosporium uncinatum TaxID=93489 RepID=A0ACC3D3S2_9PEZI|nr:hypothetical protein LTS18_006314 [Coniosporium uncinatum]
MTGNDIAVYGGLCALASMDREELRRRVLDNSDFRQFLELEPQIRRAVSMFCQSKYAACLSILDSYAADYQLDIYLHGHIKDIYSRIRSKSIVQYFIPFSCVTLDEMQKQFPSPHGIEQELEDLIRRGELNARIDLVERLLVAPTSNPRIAAQAAAIDMAKDYERTLRLRLVRLNMMNAGLELKSKASESGVMRGSYDDGGLGKQTRRSGRTGFSNMLS